jgi:hypothetical protein
MHTSLLDFSSRTVERLGNAWAYIGWLLWLPWMALLGLLDREASFRAGSSGSGFQPHILSFMLGSFVCLSVLLLFWWLCDVVDQQTEPWKIVMGALMLGIGILPMLGVGLPVSAGGSYIAIGAWLAYWMWERE